MAWYDRIIGRKVEDADETYLKLNPVQQYFQDVNSSREDHISYEKYYEELEIVNRGVNMIIDDVAEIPVRVGDPTKSLNIVKGIKRAKVDSLLNIELEDKATQEQMDQLFF